MAGSWTAEEKTEILKVFTVMATIQKTYGREIDIKPTLQAWEYLMAKDFTGAQVVAAMDAYMRKSSDMPAPADIIAILRPAPVRITQAEFIHAKEQHAKEGYPAHGYYRQIIKQFEDENHEDRAKSRPIEDKRVLEIVQSSLKKIA